MPPPTTTSLNTSLNTSLFLLTNKLSLKQPNLSTLEPIKHTYDYHENSHYILTRDLKQKENTYTIVIGQLNHAQFPP